MDTTKALAKYYGLIETVHTAGWPKSTVTTTNEIKDQAALAGLTYLIVIDFEATCWENKKGMNQSEIIEFPAVLLDLRNGKVVDEFHHYVMPMENPVLSEFCCKLTGITQDQVDNAVPLKTCLLLFSRWLKTVAEKFNFSLVGEEDKEQCTMATWTDWDIKVCLTNECNRKQITQPAAFHQWIDLKSSYSKFYERRPENLCSALNKAGLEFIGRPHSGICDAQNTARLAYKMKEDGFNFKITSKP